MKRKTAVIWAVIVMIVVGVMIFVLSGEAGYAKAYKNTEKLENYTMEISTIVTIKDNSGTKQSAIDQTVKVKNKGKKNMTYQVYTMSTSTDVAASDVVTEENSYIYKNEKYYYTYPGVKYKSPTSYEMGLASIENLTNVISFPEEKMYNTVKEDGEYMFEVEASDVSDYINTMISFAANQFDNVTFKHDGVMAAACVEGKYITERSFVVSYEGESGESITLEIYTNLISRDAHINPVNEDEYADITY